MRARWATWKTDRSVTIARDLRIDAARGVRRCGLMHRERACIVMVALVSLVLVACGMSTRSGNPDPGNRFLHMMATDPVLLKSPPNSTSVKTTLSPARYQQPGFSGGGWSGPGVSVKFASSAPSLKVYAFYAREAKAHGWAVEYQGHLQVPDVWAKSLPGYGRIFLRLVDLDSRHYWVLLG